MAAQTRAVQISAVAYTLVVISSIAVILRIYVRGWVTKVFAADDWLAVVAQILFIIFTAYEVTGVQYGTGQHIADIPEESIPIAMQMWWTCEPLYVLTNMAIKASIGIFLLRICVKKVHKIIIWAVTGVTEVYSLFFFLLFVLQCRPTSLFWLRYGTNPPDGSCIDASVIAKSFYAYSAISCLTDWTYSILPIFLVWHLQMDTKLKISVVAILATGAIASTATIVRFPYLYSLTDIGDFLYSTSDVAIWSTVETGIGITASSVATLRPLLRMFFGGNSSAPEYDHSGRQWQRTGSNHTKGTHARRFGDGENRDAFALGPVGKNIGVTTVVGKSSEDDIEAQKYAGDNGSEGSDLAARYDEWNNSQSNLATNLERPPPTGKGWNIRVDKSFTQTLETNHK